MNYLLCKQRSKKCIQFKQSELLETYEFLNPNVMGHVKTLAKKMCSDTYNDSRDETCGHAL